MIFVDSFLSIWCIILITASFAIGAKDAHPMQSGLAQPAAMSIVDFFNQQLPSDTPAKTAFNFDDIQAIFDQNQASKSTHEVTQEQVDFIGMPSRGTNCSLAPSNPCQSSLTAEELINLLQVFGFPRAAVLPVYRYTNMIVIRPLFNYPTLTPKYDCNNRFSLYITPFYNEMRKSYFTQRGNALSDYLATNDDAILKELDDLFPDAAIPSLLPLINNMRLETRRIGGMFGFTSCFHAIRFSAESSLLYLENNFFLTGPERERLNEARYFNAQLFGSATCASDQYVRDHLINDKIGIGDTRLQVDYEWNKDKRHNAKLGAQLTINTNMIFKEGIYGSTFNQNIPQPKLNLMLLGCLYYRSQDMDISIARQNQAKQELATLLNDYVNQTIDWLTATVATNPIGQYSPSIGLYFNPEFSIGCHGKWGFYIESDYFFPGNQIRTFNTVLNTREIAEADYVTDDPAQAGANIAFLEQVAEDRLYPTRYTVQVVQGQVAWARTWYCHTRSNYAWTLGFDFWYQAGERINFCPQAPMPAFDLPAAQRPAALQCKLYGMIDAFYVPSKAGEQGWKVGIVADTTLYNRGIGSDWLVGMNLTGDF